MTNRLQAKGVIAVLVLSLVARVGFARLFFEYFTHDPAMIDNLSALSQYALLFSLCFWLMRDAGVGMGNILGCNPDLKIGCHAFVFAVLLLAFAYGENFLEVYIVAQSSPEIAYKYWHFHASHYVLELNSVSYLILVVTQFMVAPLVEEFVFRGLLQRAWTVRYGLRKSILFVALAFTSLHFAGHYYVSTFIFSVVLSLLYIKFRSLWVNVGVHAIFNALAFAMEFNVGFHWERPITHLAGMKFWIPEMTMLLVSLPILVIFVRRNWWRLHGCASSRLCFGLSAMKGGRPPAILR